MAQDAAKGALLFPSAIEQKKIELDLFPFIKQFLQPCKGLVGRGPGRVIVWSGCPFEHLLLVLVVVAIEAEKLPVAAVGRVIIVVVVLVVDREFAELFAGELPAAAGAQVRVQLERLFPVGLLPLLAVLPRFGNELFLLRGSCSLRPIHVLF
jgi:hypothetical protein